MRIFALLFALSLVACKGDEAKPAPKKDPAPPPAARTEPAPPPAQPVADPSAADKPYRHGTQSGAGEGGGERKAEGDKVGAGGFKHGSGKGAGDGGGTKEAEGDKTGKHPEHGSGKGAGTGGGKKDAEGDKTGVLKKTPQ